MERRSNTVAIWCEGLDRFYSVKPIVDELKKKEIVLVVYYPNVNWHKEISSYLGIPRKNIFDMTFGRPVLTKILGHISLFFIGNLASKKFSSMYARIISDLPIKYRFLRWLTPKYNKSINKVYVKLFRLLVKSPITADTLVVVTNIHQAFWIAGYSGRIVTLVESWDHPQKSPFYHIPERAYVWNDDLSDDLAGQQDILNGMVVFPLRLRYTQELYNQCKNLNSCLTMIKNPDLRNHAESLMKNDWVTYICSSTSESWRVFPEEKRIMMSIARWAEKQKIKVYFKPKPNGLPGELDFLNDYSFSVKGISGTGCGEQMLDADYQVYRYILLNKTSLVINLYTTFGLEAAILKRPIMQMVPQKEHHNSEFFRVSLNPHLRKYFYLLDYCYPYNGSYEDIELALEECARGDCIKATQYSKHLGAWIHNNVGLMASVNEIVKDTTMINCNDA